MGRPSKKGLSKVADLFYNAGREATSTTDPSVIEFIEGAWGLGIKLYPPQRVFLKAHYGLPLDNIEKIVKIRDWHGHVTKIVTEAGYLRHLYREGRCNTDKVIPGVQRRTLMLAVGRRSGKSLITSCIMAYETFLLLRKGNPQKYYGLAEADTIQLIAVATDKDQAGLLYQKVASHFAGCDYFKGFSANQTMSYARFQTPADIEKYGRWSTSDTDRKASITITFRSCVAKGLRGAGNVMFSLDEIAHFAENNGQGSADAVYTALAPSVATFSPKDPITSDPNGPCEGRQVMITSPLGRSGFFFEHFQLGFSGSRAADDMLCIQAPTWEVNPTVDSNFLETQFRKDPENFFVEFGAEFSTTSKGWITDQRDILALIDEKAKPVRFAPSRVPHFIGIDIALVGDGCAAAVGHLTNDGKIVLDCIETIKAGVGKYVDRERLDFDEVADWIEDISRRFYLREGMFDRWAGIPFEQALAKRGLKQLQSESITQIMNSKIYKNFKDMMYDGRLVLYDYPIKKGKEHCGYIEEIFTLEEKKISKNISKVEAPNLKGHHDDMTDALVRMVWLASQNIGNKKVMKGGARRVGTGGGSGRFAQSQRYHDPKMRHAPKRRARSGSRSTSLRDRYLGKGNFK